MASNESIVKRMEILSGVGAGVIGFALGLLTPSTFDSLAVLVLFLGAVMHGYGMYRKHVMQTNLGGKVPTWSPVVEGGCWLFLAVILLYAFIKVF